MKISELRTRENYDAALADTLNACIEADARQTCCHLSNAPVQWFEHPIFSVYVTSNFCTDGRRYLNMQYRHAPRRSRRLAQAALTDIMTIPHVFSLILKPAFQLQVSGRPEYQMWMPGNHRFRRFDFESRTIRIYPKIGFSSEGIRKEIELRRQLSMQFQWILPVLRSDEETAIFDEPLLEALPFNRIPSTSRRQRIHAQLDSILNELHSCQASAITSEAYLALKRSQLEAAYTQFASKFPGVRFNLIEQAWIYASEIIRQTSEIQISLTHGDFQPGNLLVAADLSNSGLWLIDWEDAGIRASVYDAMTWTLQSRAPNGLRKRLDAFIQSDIDMPLTLNCAKKTAAALWIVEEWIWLLESSAREGITQMPAGLCTHFKECSAYLFAHTKR